jgi:predicted DCC family thiol-disulfide oxidoreductase YuxK
VTDRTGGDADVPVAEPNTSEPTGVDLAAVVEDGPVLFFDGVCNLCNGAVQFVIDLDSAERIRFASLQSDAGQTVLDRLDLPKTELATVVLLEENRAYTRSAAAIRVGELLGGVYRVASVGWLLPRGVRDWLYAFVAEHRYEWFGQKEQCMMPTPELRDRFVE